MKTQEEDSCKPRRKASEEISPTDTLILDVLPPELREDCLRHPVCGTSYGSPGKPVQVYHIP